MQTLQVKPSCQGCLWRQAPPKLSHFVFKAQASGPERQPNTLTVRLKRARQGQQQTAHAQQAGAAQSTSPQSKAEVSDQLMSYGDKDTAQQEQQMLTALQEAQKSPQSPSPDAGASCKPCHLIRPFACKTHAHSPRALPCSCKTSVKATCKRVCKSSSLASLSWQSCFQS